MFSYVEKNLNTCTYTLSFFKIRIDYILHVFLLKVCFMLDPKCHCMCFTFLWAKRFKVASWEYFFFFFFIPYCIYLTRDLARKSLQCVSTYPLERPLQFSCQSEKEKNIQLQPSQFFPCSQPELTTKSLDR